jgi:hypothetical protein
VLRPIAEVVMDKRILPSISIDPRARSFVFGAAHP